MEDFQHRELNYAPSEARKFRKHLIILTDDFPQLIDNAIIEACDGVLSRLDETRDEVIRNTLFYVYFTRAELALPSLRRIAACGGLYAPPPFFAKAPFSEVSGFAVSTYNLAGSILGEEPFMGLEVMSQLSQAAEITANVPGDFVEIGVFSGSSALVSLIHMRALGVKRKCWLLDTYSGFDYAAAKDSADMIWQGTHRMDFKSTIERIQSLMSETGQEAHVVQNNICVDNLPEGVGPIAFANIDVDMNEAVYAALCKVGKKMVKRGVMVVEDPTSTPGLYGAYLALSDFLLTELGKKFVSIRTTTQYFLVRVGD
jgi:hypothetical protein